MLYGRGKEGAVRKKGLHPCLPDSGEEEKEETRLATLILEGGLKGATLSSRFARRKRGK